MNKDDQEEGGILSTVQSTVVHSAQAGLEIAKSGIETAKDPAQAAGDAVASLAAKAAKVVRKPRKATARGKPERSARAATATRPAAKKSSRKVGAKKPSQESLYANQSGNPARPDGANPGEARADDHNERGAVGGFTGLICAL
jgi:hypothetical protein